MKNTLRAAIALCMALPGIAWATDVSGSITTTTWTADASPYRVIGAITVPIGNILTIEAGVDVLFDVDVQFIVEGALQVNGTVDDSVRFQTGTAAEWGGIRFTGSVNSSLAYTRIGGVNADADGAVYFECAGAELSMNNCVLTGNTAQNGGALHISNSAAATLAYCLIADNSAAFNGGGVYLSSPGATTSLMNCTISNNTATTGGGVYASSSDAVLLNCILWNDSPDEIAASASTISVTYSDVLGGYTGTGNINNDPLFVDAANGNYRLQSASPCVGAANDGGDIGAYDPFINLGAVTVKHGNVVVIPVTAILTSTQSIEFAFLMDTTFREISDPFITENYITTQGGLTDWHVSGDTISIASALSSEISVSDTLMKLNFTLPHNVATNTTVALTMLPDRAMEDEIALNAHDGELTVSLIYGDVSMETGVTSYDASLILKEVVGWDTGFDEVVADVSDNGTISAYDAALVLYKVVNQAFVFPCEQGAATRPADALERQITFVQDGGSWSLVIDNPQGVLSGEFTIALPEGCEGAVSSTDLVASRQEDGLLHIAIARLPSAEQVLFTITGADPVLVNAVFNEGEIPFVETTGLHLSSLSLSQNAPNPFNPVTTIEFTLPEAGVTNLVIYDVTGRQIRTLVSGTVEAGMHSVVWDGRDAVGHPSASGVYIYRLTTSEGNLVKRMTLIR